MLYSDAEMQKRVLQNMKQRLKADKVVFDQKKFSMENELQSLKKQTTLITSERNDQELTDDRTNKVYKKYLRQLEKEHQEREQHLRSLEAMIDDKQRVYQINEDRTRELRAVA
jgi:arginyl-tRNA--protein-N-Asp/Glu arginylyltransferase